MTIEDIEEITFPADSTEDVKSNRADSRFVTKRVLKSRFPSVPKNAHENDENAKSTAPISDDFHFLPDQHKIFVKTWGCSHNNSDSEYMAGLLVAHGYSLIMSDADRDSADLWLLNSCTVKNPSEQTFVNEIKRAQKQGIPVVLAGCVPQAQPNNDNWSRLSVIGVQQIDRVVEVVEETLKGNTVRLFSVRRELVKHDDDGDSDNESSTRKKKAGGASLDLPKIRKNPYVEIIPINTGCLNQCTYCKTKHARGDLGSYPPEEIVGRVKSVLNEGISEIWLTSEDTGAYGRDISKKLPDLLRQIVTVLEEAYSSEKKEVMLRVGMTNPPYILDDLEEIAEILNHDRVFKFLHIPVQSGSDRVLDDMRRQYTCKDFREVVEFLRKNVPGITIATDLICGFPTEQEEDHQDSYKLIDDFKFPVLHISQFYPRPGTPAARMQRLPTNIVKERSREITKLFESYTSYEPLMNTVQRVWITDEISKKAATDDSIPSGEDDYANTLNQNRYDDCWVAHDIYYHQVLIPKDQIREVMANSESWANQSSLLGFACDVRIFHAGKHYLVGKLESLDTLKMVNNTDITSSVLLHRVGKKNRKVLAKNTENKEQKLIQSSDQTKPTTLTEEGPFSSLSRYSLYMAFALFLGTAALHVLSIPALIKMIDPKLYNHYPLLKSIEVDFLQPHLESVRTQIILWTLLTVTMARVLSVPSPEEENK